MKSPETPDAVDAVITWVDGSDPSLRKKQEFYFPLSDGHGPTSRTRFASNGEIKWCVASILKFGKYFRNIFIITDNQTPEILSQLEFVFKKEDLNKIRIIDHNEIFRGYEEYLPVFNSLAIETMIHRIVGLSEKFVYFNDDIFLMKESQPDDFFVASNAVLRCRTRSEITYNIIRQFETRWRRKPIDFFSSRGVQYNAAKVAGFRGKYLRHDHTPHPMDTRLLEDFYNRNPEAVVSNIRYRVRDYRQFDPIALSYCLSYRNDAPVIDDTSFLYAQFGKSSGNGAKYFARKFDDLGSKDYLYSCLQSLDLLPAEQLTELETWLDERFLGRDDLDLLP